jgi:hypothetical protein
MSTLLSSQNLAAAAVELPKAVIAPAPKEPFHIRLGAASPESDAAIAAALKTKQTGRGQNDLSCVEVRAVAKQAEASLEKLGLRKSIRPGARFRFAESGASANAYKYAIPTTLITLRRDARGWLLVEVERVYQQPKAPVIQDVHLSNDQAAVLDGKLNGYRHLRMKASGPYKLAR